MNIEFLFMVFVPFVSVPILLDTEGSAGSLVARHSLSYIQEIGNGLFGKVGLIAVAEPVVALLFLRRGE